MKLTWSVYVKETIHLWLSSIVEFLLFLPLWILFQVYVLPRQVESMWMITLPFISLLGILLRYRCNVRWKQLLAALILGGILGIGSVSPSIYSLPLGAAGFVCAYLGMTVDSRNNRSKMYWMGIVFYFVAVIVFQRIPELKASLNLLTWCGSLCLLLTLLSSNSSYLRYSSLTEDTTTLPEGIQRNNRIYVIVIGIIAAVLAAGVGKAIGTLIWSVIRSFFDMIIRLFSTSNEPPLPPVEAPLASPELLPIGDQNPGLLAAIFDVVFYMLGAVFLGIIVYYGVRWLYRNAGGKLRAAMDALLSMLRRERSPQGNRAYLDEEKSVFTWEQTVQGLKEFWTTRFGSRHQKDRWEQMNSERERVRYLFRRFLLMKRHEGYEVRHYLTPKETNEDIILWSEHNKHKQKGNERTDIMSRQLIECYEKVRYGEDEPSASEVAALKDQLKL